MQNRLEIERAILGAIIYCDGYPEVAHILTAKNFTSSPELRHQELFGIVATLFPGRPIDLITVSDEIRKAYPQENALLDLLYGCQHVSAPSNVSYWAMMLLQIDISDKYRAKVIEWKELRDRELEHSQSGALLELIETINGNEDIFNVIEISIQYFEKENMTHELEEAREFFQGIAKRAQQIQRVNSIQIALRHLLSITRSANPQVEFQCQAFAKAIADMITTGQVNERYTKAVDIIYQ